MTIILADTNIIFPQVVWDLYRDSLSKTESGGKLTFNTNIQESLLEKAIIDSEKTYTELTKQLSSNSLTDIYLTQEIHIQVSNLYQQIKSNIEQRGNMHLFTQFSKLTPENQKITDEKIYVKLQLCEDRLDQLNSITKTYKLPHTANYFLLNEFLRALKDDFFDLTKEKHNYDYGADMQLATTAIYENLVNGTKAKIISNDNDVINMVSATYIILQKSKNVLKGTSYSNHLNNPDIMPELLKFTKTGIIEQIDLVNKGNELINFSGFEGHTETAKKSEYNSLVGRFANFLNNYTNRLKEIDQNK